MRVLIACFGSAGDVHPFLALGTALRARGHEVELQASEHFRARVEAAGLTLLPLGSDADYAHVVSDADLWHPRRSFALMWREMARHLPTAHAALAARVRAGDTVLVGSTLAWQTRLLQDTHGVPAVTVHLSPMCLFSGVAPARLPGLPSLGGWPPALVRALHWLLEQGAIDRVVAPPRAALPARLGLAPVRRVMSHWVNAPARVVCAWPDWFAPPQADWPAQARPCGFLRWPAPPAATLPAALEQFLATGPAPVGFTPGSAMAQGRDFFERALAACAALGQRALLLTPFTDQLPASLPPWACQVGYAPFDRLLPRLRALVHHGGIGTSVEAATAGLPQGFVPLAHDQFDNAERWIARGVGLRLPRRDWSGTLARLLADASIAAACRRAAAQVRGADGVTAAVEMVEALGR